MKQVFLCSLALAVTATAGAFEHPHDGVEGSLITITGCVAGSDSDSFVLTHVQKTGDSAGASTGGAMLGAGGMEPATSEVIYWLSKDSIKKMRGHVGHKVEVMGKITDVSSGTVEVKQEPGKSGPDNKVEVDARGKDASAKTDRAVEPGAAPRMGTKVDEKKTMPVHRIDVDTVRMIAATCP
jgi:hypothetical protein